MAYIGKKPSFTQVRTSELVTPKKSTDITSVSSGELDPGAYSLVRIASGVTTIDGITAPTSPANDGKMLVIVNGQATDVTISNEKGSMGATKRITTGTGSDLTLAAGASLFLVYRNSSWGVVGGTGSGGGSTAKVSQAAHGFGVGDVLYMNGSTYTKAIATAANTAEVVGVVSRVIDSGSFEFTLQGKVSGLSGLTAGGVYFLSSATAGLATLTEPTAIGQISIPLGVAASTTELYVAIKRGVVVGGANVRTQITLANNTTANIQDVSNMEAGELAGWVSITNTTAANSLRFYVQAQWSKNGAGTDWNLSYQTTGNTPPAGFNIGITSAGIIQYTMPNVSGFSSASINYALNAPAIGTNFPLSIGARNVVGDTTGTAVPAGYIGEVIEKTVSSSVTTSTPTIGTYYDVGSSYDILLNPGVYVLEWIVGLSQIAWASGAGTAAGLNISIRTGNTVVVEATIAEVGDNTSGFYAVTNSYRGGSVQRHVVVTSPTTYKISYKAAALSGSASLSSAGIRGDVLSSYFTARRIA